MGSEDEDEGVSVSPPDTDGCVVVVKEKVFVETHAGGESGQQRTLK